MKDPNTDTCAACAKGQIRPEPPGINLNYSVWESQQGVCAVAVEEIPQNYTALIAIVATFSNVFLLLVAVFFNQRRIKPRLMQYGPKRAMKSNVTTTVILGRGAFGKVLKPPTRIFSTSTELDPPRLIEEIECQRKV